MQSQFAAGYVGWVEMFLVLAVGTGGIILAAAVAARRLRSAVWQRTVWQAALVAVLGLIAVEAVGAGAGLVGWLRTFGPASTTPPGHGVAAAGPTAAPVVVAVDPSAAPLGAAEQEPFVEITAFRDDATGEADTSPAADAAAGAAAGNGAGAGAGAAASSSPLALGEGPGVRALPNHPSSLIPHPSFPRAWPVFVWTLGALLILARTLWARFVLSRFRGRSADAAGLEPRSCVERVARRVGLRGRVRLLEHTGLNAPVAFGVVRPTVIVPAGFSDRFSREEQEVILAHELAHLAARDPLWQLVAEVACALAWWHPAVWWLRGRMRAASETAADEASLLVPGGPGALAGCLVALGRRIAGRRPLGWLSFQGSGFRSGLGRRVERLLSLKGHAGRVPARAGVLEVLAQPDEAIPKALIQRVIERGADAEPVPAGGQQADRRHGGEVPDGEPGPERAKVHGSTLLRA